MKPSLGTLFCAQKLIVFLFLTDIRELVELDDVMEADDLKLGPNGGLVFCIEYVFYMCIELFI